MKEELSSVVAALARLDEAELHELVEATRIAPRTAPALLTWIVGACDWELHRRHGHEHPLLPPTDSIPPEEDAASIYATIAIRETFDQDILADSLRRLLDAIVALFSAPGRRG